MPVELSGYEVAIGATFEMDGLIGFQRVAFAIARGTTPASLRDRVLITFGACFHELVRRHAADLGIEVGEYPYRILEVHGFWFRPVGSPRWIPMTDTDGDWCMAESFVFRESIKWVVKLPDTSEAQVDVLAQAGRAASMELAQVADAWVMDQAEGS